jgi:hypothetical protein
MQGDVQRELEELGFSERQARVYVTLLRFGPSAVQQIALAAGLPRASCYDTLQQLVKQGLVKGVEDASQQVFVTEPPGRINMLLSLQLEEVQARRRRAEIFLPRLEALAGDGDARPRFRIINDAEELRQLHQEYADMGKPHLQIIGYDAFLALHRESVVQDNVERLRHKPTQGRAILVTDLPIDAPIGSGFEVRRVPTAMLEIQGEMAVCGDRIILFAFTDKVVAIEIVSQAMANTCRAALELAWLQAGEIEKRLRGG